MIMEMHSFYNYLLERNIILSYCGPIKQDGIEGIAATIKDKLAADEVPLSTSMSIFSIFVEQIQNILNYSAERQIIYDVKQEPSDEVSNGIFVLGRIKNVYFTQCGNKIKNEELKWIEESIGYLNSLNKDEIKAYYRERRKAENNNPISKGAGLGLIEIARRSYDPLRYEFTKIDDEHSFFSLHATIKIG